MVPSDAKDPFYTNWTKEGPLMNGLVNPIVNSTGDDPSTAWQNPAKTGESAATVGLGCGRCRDSDGRPLRRTEWTLIGNQQCKSELDEANGGGGGAPICATTPPAPTRTLPSDSQPTSDALTAGCCCGVNRRLD